MKITAQSKPLIEALKAASSAMTSRTTLPVLTCALIEGDKDGVRVTCDSLDVRMTVEVGGFEFGKPFAFLAPPRLLTLALRGEEAEITLEKNRIVVESGGRTILASMAIDEFPPHPSGIDVQPLDGAQFLSALTATIESASSDSTQWVINGAHWEHGKNEMVATNRTTLLIAPCETPLTESVNIPTGLARLILSNFDGEDALSIGVSGSSLRVQSESRTITGKLIEGNFPNYRQVIPEGGKKLVTVNRVALHDAFSALSGFVESLTSQIVVKHEGDTWTLRGGDKGNESSVSLKVEGKKPFETFAVSCQRMIGMIKGWRSDEVEIDMSDCSSPLLLRPKGEDGRLGVLMPLRVSQ